MFFFAEPSNLLLDKIDGLRDALYETAVAAGLGPVKEGRALLPGDDRRPADILVPNWAGGRDAAMDVTVVTPLQAATVAEAAITPGSALSFAYQRKVRGAAEDCRSVVSGYACRHHLGRR